MTLARFRNRGPLSLELFNHQLWEKDPLQVVTRGLERIRGLVEGCSGIDP